MDVARKERSEIRTQSKGGTDALPEEIFLKILCLLPAREIASTCALVCQSWRGIASGESLWKELCDGSGLRDIDALHFTTWRALFGAVYGTNLVGGPHFERMDRIDAKRLKNRIVGACEPVHRLYPDCIYYDNELHEEPHSFCMWSPDGGSRFQRGGGDGIIRECPPVGCPPCPGAPDKDVLATSHGWGKVFQSVDLSHFPKKFLDRSPSIFASVWYAGKSGTLGLFKIHLGLRDKFNNVFVSWYSGELKAQPNKWKEAKRLIHSYPKGLQSIVVTVSGMSLVNKSGFHGAKYTAIQMKFIAPGEVHGYEIVNDKLGKVRRIALAKGEV